MTTLKFFDDSLHTLLDVIDAADEEGMTRCVVPKRWLPQGVTRTTKKALLEVLETVLQPYGLFTGNSLTWLNAIQAQVHTDDQGNWVVAFHAGKFFRLPCKNVTQELAELRGWLDQMRGFFLAHADLDAPGRIRLMNERDGNGRVYGSLLCLGESQEAHHWNAVLQSQLKGSEVLTEFMRQTALALSKIGRYSWGDLREEQLFAPDQRPWEQAFYKKRFADRTQ